jgi:ligand-binding sensor domain-containing protein
MMPRLPPKPNPGIRIHFTQAPMRLFIVAKPHFNYLPGLSAISLCVFPAPRAQSTTAAGRCSSFRGKSVTKQSGRSVSVKTHLKALQWLVLLLAVWLPLAGMAASTAPTPNFPSTEPEFETLRDAENVDNRPITALAQDGRGLIWIGTQTGLVRYDGYRFRKFVHKATDPFSLAGDFVTALTLAKDGRLWVGTASDGISVFDPASERFETFRHDEKVPDSVAGGRIRALLADARGQIWIATDQGLDCLSLGSRSFIHFRHSTDPHSLLDDKVHSLLQDKAGRLWVGSSGLQRLSPDGKRFETVIVDREVRTLFEAQDGKLWLGTREHGAAWLDASQQVYLQVHLQVHWLPLAQQGSPRIIAIAQVKTDQIWLASHGGGMIVLAASDGQVLQTLRHDTQLASSLALDTVSSLLLDRAGWLWVGTSGAGLQRMNTNNSLLSKLRHSAKRPNGLSHPDVMSVLELADGRLAFGSKGNGIDLFDRQRGLIGGYRTSQQQPGALPDANIYALAQTADGSLWAGTQKAGLVRQMPGSSAWVVVPGLPDQQVRKLLVGRDGSLWVGTDRGVARWQPGARPAQPLGRVEVLTDQQGKPMQACRPIIMPRLWSLPG